MSIPWARPQPRTSPTQPPSPFLTKCHPSSGTDCWHHQMRVGWGVMRARTGAPSHVNVFPLNSSRRKRSFYEGMRVRTNDLYQTRV